ncbi:MULTISPECIES: hypothetical protein [unclassified Cupriavidus]|uniref:hypothetical protein n=1 Tax=Cupriavidus sp. H19C3 TaxID=3241603 RepID=UPI003BF89235
MDSRGFRYGLEPALKRFDWRVDRATRELAEATAAWMAQRDRHAALTAEHDAVLSTLDASLGAPIDVVQRGQALRYLGQTRVRLARSAGELDACATVRQTALRALADAHRAMELLTQHKQDSREDYAAEAARRASLAADDDWTARQGWKQSSPETEQPGEGEPS